MVRDLVRLGLAVALVVGFAGTVGTGIERLDAPSEDIVDDAVDYAAEVFTDVSTDVEEGDGPVAEEIREYLRTLEEATGTDVNLTELRVESDTPK